MKRRLVQNWLWISVVVSVLSVIPQITLAMDWTIVNPGAYLYFGTTDKPLTVAWDSQEGIEFAFNLYHYEDQAEVARGRTQDAQVVFMLPRTGHYHTRICAVANTGDPITEEYCSISTDPTKATVGGQPQGWWVFGNIAPPGEIIIP
jgi:hypothetical protein